MKLERLGPAVLRVTLHSYEAATLMAAARWAAEGGDGELSADAREQLRRVVASWDGETQRVLRRPAERPTAPVSPAA